MDELTFISEALYAKHNDIQHITGDLTRYICDAVNKIIPREAAAAQLMRGVWHIFVKNASARSALLLHGSLLINNTTLRLYNEDPHSVRSRIPNERVLFKDIPLLESSNLIYDFLDEHPQVEPVGGVKFSFSRNTEYANGDRFIYVRGEFTPPLEKTATLGEHRVRIWHASQSRSCERCGTVEHKTSEIDKCPAYMNNANAIAFKNPRNVLTNFYPCDIKIEGQTFKSSEHAYLWQKCTDVLEPGLAERIFHAGTAAEAKEISRELPRGIDYSEWNKKKLEVMRNVLQAKLKCCSLYGDALRRSGTNILVEATKDPYWGANLSPYLVKSTKPDLFPGMNFLGKLHMEIRHQMLTRDNPAHSIPDVSSSHQSAPKPTAPVAPPAKLFQPALVNQSTCLSSQHDSEKPGTPAPKQPRDNLKRLQNPIIDLLKVSDAVKGPNPNVYKRLGRPTRKTSAKHRSMSLPLSMNKQKIRRETRLISGFLSKKVTKKAAAIVQATSHVVSNATGMVLDENILDVSIDSSVASFESAFDTDSVSGDPPEVTE